MTLKQFILTLWILLAFLAGAAAQPALRDAPGPVAGKSVRIHPSDISQTEVLIVRHPYDPEAMFVACNTLNFVPFFISEGIYVTTDGGETWQGSDTCRGEPIAFHGGDPGIAIDKNGTFILTRLGRSPFVGLYSHYSSDQGLTWSAQKVISTDDLERASLHADLFPGSPWYGRTYAAWVKFALPFPVMFSYTANGGQAWTTPVQVNNPPHRSAGGDVAVGPGGEVYLCWAGVTDVSPFKEIYVGFAKSSDGGAGWQVTENAFPVNGITGVLSNKSNIRVNGLPSIAVDTTPGPRRGWIYLVTTQKDLAPAGSDPDVILYRSADGGATWSPGIRVNRDALNNGKTQYFPNLHIDRYGAVNVLFYDDRNTTNDSTGVFLARSQDGGETWNEYEISDHRFRPEPIGGLGQGYQGDLIDLTSTGTDIRAVWMDNSTGVYQVWTVPVAFSGLGEEELPGGGPTGSLVLHCRPNPFRGSADLTYRLSSAEQVTLEVFDPMGRKVTTLVMGRQTAGWHRVTFTPAAVRTASCGRMFFCRLTAGDRVVTGRLVQLE